MTTRLETPTERDVEQSGKDPRRPVILHYVSTFAIDMGMEDKALCGLWMNPDRATSGNSHKGRPARTCKRCQRAYEKIARAYEKLTR